MEITRKQLLDKIEANHQRIEQIRIENIEIKREAMLLCDDVQQYYEKEEEVIVQRRPKIVEKQLRGYIKWNEDFKDEGTGEVITIERNELVRVNGEWI